MLLEQELLKQQALKTLTFQRAVRKNRQLSFQVLYHKEVYPDNNGSERGAGNFKVKLKISNELKTGQDTYATLRSIIDISNKREIPVLQSLKCIALMPIRAVE